MKIEDLLLPQNILLNLEAKNKQDALKKVAKAFCELNPQINQASLVKGLLKRETLGSTAIGGGSAIPHTQVPSVEKPIGFLAVTKAGIDYQAIDGNPVRLIFLIVYPPDEVGGHLKALAKVASLLRDKFARESVMHAPTAELVIQILITEEKRKMEVAGAAGKK